MPGFDDKLAAIGNGETFLVVIAVAVLLGLRHATDPDHLVAVSTLLASERSRSPWRAARLGASWGAGHATTLVLFGLPVVLFDQYLPRTAERAAEVAVGIVIIALALRLLSRWRRGSLRRTARTPLQAYGVGLVHGVGGSAGIAVLVLAAIPSPLESVLALVVFAAFTAVSMAIASTGFGYTLTRSAVMQRFAMLVPALGAFSLAFGCWYALAALDALPSYL